MRTAHQKLKDLLQVFSNETRDGVLGLPGIGTVTGDKLLAKRSEVADQGRALRLTDVMEVEGIGAVKLAKLTGEPMTSNVIKYATHYNGLFGSKVCYSFNNIHVTSKCML